MKKNFRKFMCLIVMAMTAMATLTSCEDEMISRDLQGIWRGEVAQTFFTNRYGRVTEYTDVEIEFQENPFSMRRGTGCEYDYERYGRYTSCRFNYEVNNGNIYLDYADGAHIAIYNFRLNNSYFEGEFHDYRTGEYLASFRLRKVYDPYYQEYYYKTGKTMKFISPEEVRAQKFVEDKMQELTNVASDSSLVK